MNENVASTRLQLALKGCSEAQTFTCSSIWTALRKVLKLSVGPHAPLNVRFFVTDAELAAKDLLIGLPVFHPLGFDSEILLKNRRDLLDGTNCAPVTKEASHDKIRRVGTLMTGAPQPCYKRQNQNTIGFRSQKCGSCREVASHHWY